MAPRFTDLRCKLELTVVGKLMTTRPNLWRHY